MSYRGADHSSHLLAKVGGFLILPVVGSFATKLAAPAVESLAPKANPGYIAAGVGGVLYGALAYGFYKASESGSLSPSMQSLFRGGMWGSGLTAAYVLATPAINPPGPIVSGPNPKLDTVFQKLTGNAANEVTKKRMRKAPRRLATAR